MSGHSAEDMRAHVKTYMMVFGALGVLTLATVGASYLQIPLGPAIALALAIATLKASLVALFFMHLKGEVRAIVWTLMLTALFFIVLICVPISGFADSISMNWDSWSLSR
jgi:cytochrome c oxidase subunit 4